MNNNVTKRIKDEDSRAFSKFLIILVIALFVGGFFGIISTIIKVSFADIIETGITDLISFISPYAIITVTAAFAIAIMILYSKSRTAYRNWDGENEDDLCRIETLLSYALWFSSLSMILSYFFFAAGFALDSIEAPLNLAQGIRFLLLFIGIILSMVALSLEQQKIINFEKEINPEKKGSVFDIRFAKKWEGSSDEAEKLTIYKSAYKSYRCVSFTCMILWVFCIMGAIIWNIGMLPVAIVSIIWIVLVSSYCLETIHLAKNPSEIHK